MEKDYSYEDAYAYIKNNIENKSFIRNKVIDFIPPKKSLVLFSILRGKRVNKQDWVNIYKSDYYNFTRSVGHFFVCLIQLVMIIWLTILSTLNLINWSNIPFITKIISLLCDINMIIIIVSFIGIIIHGNLGKAFYSIILTISGFLKLVLKINSDAITNNILKVDAIIAISILIFGFVLNQNSFKLRWTFIALYLISVLILLYGYYKETKPRSDIKKIAKLLD